LKDPQGRSHCVRQLSIHRDQAIQVFRSWANRVRLPQHRSTDLLEVITKAFSNVIDEVNKLPAEHSSELTRDTNKDPVLIALEPLLRGRVGRPLGKSEHEEALKEAKTRADRKQPPGYKDLSKTDGAAAGDYLIWIQILREANARKRDVLLITGDVKEDWWRREHGEVRGPRPELVQEIKEYANVKLYMLRPESLLHQARQTLEITIRDGSVEDAERVGKASMVGIESVRQSWDEILASAGRHSKVASKYLATASADSLNEDALTVLFRRPADAQDFTDSGSAAALYQALDEVLGIERGIIVYAPGGHYLAPFVPQYWPLSGPEAEASGALPEDDTDLAD
jgi:PIN like domain